MLFKRTDGNCDLKERELDNQAEVIKSLKTTDFLQGWNLWLLNYGLTERVGSKNALPVCLN